MTTPGKNQPTRSNPNSAEEQDEGMEEREGVRAPAEEGDRKPEQIDDAELERSLRDEEETEDDDGDTVPR